MTVVSGSTTITEAWLQQHNNGSRVIEGRRFTGQVTVATDNVTIRDFVIEGGRYNVYNNVFTGNPTTGLVLQDGELRNASSSGLAVSNTVAERLHIHHMGADAVKPFSNVVLADSYIHHLGSNAGSHSDGVQMVGGSNVTIRGNNFEMRHDEPGYTNSQVVILKTDMGPISNVHLDRNWINGGGFSVQVVREDAALSNIRITDNRFGRDYQFGPIRISGATVTRTGNVWDDTGEPL